MARPKKQRIIGARERRLYVRFTEAEYALLSRLGVLTGRCPADTVYSLVQQAMQQVLKWSPDLENWWYAEINRIIKEDQDGTN